MAAALVVLALGVCNGGTSASFKEDTPDTDSAAIEKLHKADIEATLTQDLSALSSLWPEDAVKLDVPGAPVVGLKALKEMYEKFRIEHSDFKVVKYAPKSGEVKIVIRSLFICGTVQSLTSHVSAPWNPFGSV